MTLETFHEVEQWAAETNKWILKGMQDLKVGVTGDLKASLRYQVRTNSTDIRVNFSFRLKGKFVDQGAGRGQQANTKKTKRKAKKYFSKNFYGGVARLRNILRVRLESDVRKIFEEI